MSVVIQSIEQSSLQYKYSTYNVCLLYDTAHSLLFQSTSIMNIQQKMSSTKRISSSSHRTVTCSRHDIAEKFLIWH